MTDLALGFKITAKGGESIVATVKDVRAEATKIKQTNREAAETAARLQKQYNLTEKEAEQLTQELVKSAQAAESLKKEAEETAKALEERAVKAAGALGGALAAAIGGLFAKGAIDAAEYDRVLSGVEQRLASTGGTAGVSLAEIQTFADGLGDATLTSEEATLRASSALLSFQSVQGDTFFRALTISQDLAETLGGDLESNIIQVGKALEVPVKGLNALSRSGTQFTEQQQAQIKALVASGDQLGAQNLILSELEKQYGGTAVAAAQGLAGALDTLGENTNDLFRVFGEQAQPAATALVNVASQLIDTFVQAPPAVQRFIVVGTGLVGVLGAAVAVIAAYNLALQSKIVQETLDTAVALKGIAARTAKNVVDTAATAIQAALAIATGKATQAQIAQVAAVGTAVASMAALAGAVAAVAVVADTFTKTTAAAGQARDSIAEVQAKLDQLNAVGSANPIEALAGSEAQQNLQALQNDLGGVQSALDRVRGVIPGLATAQEASVNRQTVAFGELTNKIGEVEEASFNLIADLSNGAAVPAEEIQKTVEAIDAAISAQEAELPVGKEAIAQRDAQISRLETYREKILENTDATANLSDVTGGLSDAIKGLNADLQDAQAELERTASEAVATARELEAAGSISGEEADRRVATAEESQLNDRIALNREKLDELRELQASAQDPDAQAEINREIIRLETELNRDRVTLAQDQVQAQEDAAKASADAAKEAEAERTKAAEAAAKERERIAKAEADAVEDAREQDRKEAQETFDAGAEQRAKQLETQLQGIREQGQAAIAAERERLEADLQNEQKTFAKQQQAEARAFQKQQQTAAQAFQRQLDAERNRGNQELDAVAQAADDAFRIRTAGSDQERQQIEDEIAERDRLNQIRREEEARALANRDQIVGDAEQSGELGLSPLEQARADFEQSIQDKQAAFQEQQQQAAQAFQEAQALAAEEQEAKFNEQRKANAAAIAQAEKDLQAELDEARNTARADERERERTFAAEQRRLDEQSAQRVKAILDSANAAPTPRFRGGPLESGQPYTVAEKGPEIARIGGREYLYDRPTLINPKQRGWVYTAAQPRQKLAARATQMGTGRSISVTTASPEVDIAGLRQDVQALHGAMSRNRGGDTYNLQGFSKGMTPADMALQVSAGLARQALGG
ncbi:MAG: hypothetical protein ACFB0C_15690 [Leptolyngbyaceae cyanobacterium]